MSLLKWLGLGKDEDAAESAPGRETETVRKIVGELKALDAEQARYVAAFAYVLSRVAYADRDISDDEIRVMERLVVEQGKLPEAQAVLAVEIARNQAVLFGGTENYLVTRQFKEMSTRAQREDMMHCLFAVAAADDSIDSSEEAAIRLISGELGFTQREFVDVRSAYNDQRAVVKMSRGG